jgi:tetratricopeptide (TPR) repeat protein
MRRRDLPSDLESVKSMAWGVALALALAAAAPAYPQEPQPSPSVPPAAAQGPAAQGPGAQPSPPPIPEDVQRELVAAQDLLGRAQTEFDGSQQSRSIALLEDLATRLETLRRQGQLPPRGKGMLVTAYELRGRAYFNIGLSEKAADSFRQLLQVQPQFALSKDRVSPKVVDFFNGVKKGMVGFLAVSSKPAGARVTLNGEFLSLTDFFPLEVLAGDYTVEVSRDGYLTETRAVTIAPRGTQTLNVPLSRTAASAWVITQPPQVEVWVDGQLRGTTSGALSPDQAEAARAKGIDPARASSRTEIPNLSLGNHVLEFRRRCYETVKRTIDVPEALDYDAEPALLEDSVASLHLDSDPPGGRIYLDNDPNPVGVTPKDLDGVCSGRHHIEVKHGSGRFIQDVILGRNEALSLDCPIRPSLAYLGLVASGATAQRAAGGVEESLKDRLTKIRTLNVLPAPKDRVQAVLDSEKLTLSTLVGGSADADTDAVRRATEKLAAAMEVQGFLVAVLPDEKIQRTAGLFLLAAGNTVSDRFDVSLIDTASFDRFLAAVDRQTSLFRTWAGLVTVDTATVDGVPVLRTTPLSPAAVAGVGPGDVVTAVDGKPVKQTADLMGAVDARKPKDKLALQVRGPSGARNVELTLGQTPQEISLNDPSLLYNKVMMELRQQVEGYPGTEVAALARLDLAICAMHFGDFAAAHEHLLRARSELPARPGISQGTALYYLAVTLDRLGYGKEAADAYRAASGLKDATVFNNDGPLVAPIAARRAAATP